jgi:outer membrane protein assembly factor BamB
MQTENSKGPIHLYSEQVRFQQGIPLNRLESIYNNTNEIIWQTEMSYDFSMPPLFWETKILVATERGGVYCISRKTGDIIWHIENIAISNLAISNNSVYFFADDEKLMEVDLQSGEVRGFVQFGVDDFVTNENTFIGSYYVAYDAQTKTVFVQFGDSAQLFALQVLGK